METLTTAAFTVLGLLGAALLVLGILIVIGGRRP